jgi:hypothetical protein
VTGIFEGRGTPRPHRWYWKRTDPSSGAPDDESGILLPVQLLATPSASIVLGNLTAYSTGLEFMLTIRYEPEVLDPHGGCHHYYQGGDPDRCLRIGLQLGDGTRITSLDHLLRGDQQAPPLARLRQTWGGGLWKRWWVHPLPPPGPILFVLEWPFATKERVTAQLDGDAIREAASRSIRLWET